MVRIFGSDLFENEVKFILKSLGGHEGLIELLKREGLEFIHEWLRVANGLLRV